VLILTVRFEIQAVDFTKLEMSSLQKYQAHFKVECKTNVTKMDLLESVRRHFTHHPRLREADVISAFLYAIRREEGVRNRMRWKNH